jgi:tetratricopeptide (TPR) repeat protein
VVAGEDVGAIAKARRGEVALTGSVRTEGDRLRVNLRYIDLAMGTERWAERFEGAVSASFAMEDTLARAAEAALRAIAGGADAASMGGPADPAARALYERALDRSHRMNEPEAIEEALVLARKAIAIAPSDASVMSLLGLVLVRVAIARRTDDKSVMSEAEDWALRALDADASSAQTYVTLGLLRLHQGDLRASVRAFREALQRDPRNAEASAYLGRFLVESGYLDEGIERLEFALKLDPNVQHAWWNLARSYALCSRWEQAESTLQRASAMVGTEVSLNIVRARLAFWRRDHEYAQATADRIESSAPEGHFVRGFIAPLRAFANGEKIVEQASGLMLTGTTVVSPAMKAFWFQVAAEAFALSGRVDAALDAVDSAVALAFVDVGWMDHCPVLAIVRGAGRFGQARAIVSARAANLWK